jgi:opacity protein-like surface antigen
MKEFVLVLGAANVIAIPSIAHAGNPYVTVEAGVGQARNNDIDQTASFGTTQSPSSPLAPPAESDTFFDDAFETIYSREHSAALIAGYDFGWFRAEVEVGRKRSRIKGVDQDDLSEGFLTDINTALNRPSASPDPGAPGLAPLTLADFHVDGRIRVLSVMLNGYVEKRLGPIDLSIGAGAGQSFGKAVGDTAEIFGSWQYMLGARVPVTHGIELGVKYRYFNSGNLKFDDKPGFDFTGNPDRLTIPVSGGSDATVDRTTSVRVVPDIEGEYRSRALLLSLTYNFGE